MVNYNIIINYVRRTKQSTFSIFLMSLAHYYAIKKIENVNSLKGVIINIWLLTDIQQTQPQNVCSTQRYRPHYVFDSSRS
jgi:hypothetical protein